MSDTSSYTLTTACPCRCKNKAYFCEFQQRNTGDIYCLFSGNCTGKEKITTTIEIDPTYYQGDGFDVTVQEVKELPDELEINGVKYRKVEK